MLFNWAECNSYSITVGPEKRKILEPLIFLPILGLC
jgi:predicted membrane protein